jgi:TrmH family RNA methyltransferase
MTVLRSRDNPRVRRWRDLVRDARARKAERRAVIEGVHLVSAYLEAGGRPHVVIAGESAGSNRDIRSLISKLGVEPVLVSDSIFRLIADSETPQGIAAEVAIPEGRPGIEHGRCAVLLDGIQDAGNVGAILRSAAAFGVRDVVLGPGCADAWSPKVLRAGMGAHFVLRLALSEDPLKDVEEFRGSSICTIPRNGKSLQETDLSGPVLWIFGGEGQGVSEALAARATLGVTIPMPGAAESLNVAAAAAICFYEMTRQVSRPAARS